jgi:hypothetical protein
MIWQETSTKFENILSTEMQSIFEMNSLIINLHNKFQRDLRVVNFVNKLFPFQINGDFENEIFLILLKYNEVKDTMERNMNNCICLKYVLENLIQNANILPGIGKTCENTPNDSENDKVKTKQKEISNFQISNTMSFSQTTNKQERHKFTDLLSDEMVKNFKEFPRHKLGKYNIYYFTFVKKIKTKTKIL